MPFFISVLLSLLPLLLEWLLGYLHRGEQLPDRAAAKVARILGLMAQCQRAASQLGVMPQEPE